MIFHQNTPAELRFLAVPQAKGQQKTSCVEREAVKAAREFHRGMDGYAPTPLVELPALAADLGIQKFWVKDESKRFGLNAFKALGGSYAMADVLCRRLGLEMGRDTFQKLRLPEVAEQIRNITFVTATDGNHGRGVAWTAKMLGCTAVVYLPEGSAKERLQNILDLGAQAEIMPWNYDDTVRYADEMARKNGWILVQDTSWTGYEEIPTAILQGYTTMAAEIVAQLQESGGEIPTHVFLQAGVGSMAGAVAGYLTSVWGERSPKILIVEPDRADCLYRTAKANDGALHVVTGKLDSMMAGLCCGEPCPIGWEILKDTACGFLSCRDLYAAHGMRLLGKPMGGDAAVVSGESGAVTAGVAVSILKDPALADVRDALQMDRSARVLVISTEGDTDRENYQKMMLER